MDSRCVCGCGSLWAGNGQESLWISGKRHRMGNNRVGRDISVFSNATLECREHGKLNFIHLRCISVRAEISETQVET